MNTHWPAIEPSFRKRAEARELQMPPALPAGNLFWRNVTARAVAQVSRQTPLEVATRLWPSDGTLHMLLRAVSAPATLTTSPWAPDLGHKVVIDALEGLGPAAAGAQLLLQSLVLNWDRNTIISAPGFVRGAGNASFVAEAAPIPVKQMLDAAVQLTPKKLAAISVLTREMVESSNAEQLIGDVLKGSAELALDQQLFSTNAATAAAPAGIRNGVVSLTASAATDPLQQFYEDSANLVNAVSVVGGNGPFVLIGSPGRIAAMMMRFVLVAGNVSVLSSNAVGNDYVCVAPRAMVCALDPEPSVEMAAAGTLHMEDTTPLDIVSGGVSAAPAKGMFQTESWALKMRWPVTWAVRDPRAVAWVTPAWK
jgi:hypothetical protein